MLILFLFEMRGLFREFWISERGSVADEYALVVTMVVLMGAVGLHAAGVPLSSLGDFITSTFSGVAGLLGKAPDSSS